MKKLYSLAFIGILLLCAFATFANEVTVKGYLKYTHNAPCKNTAVAIAVQPTTNNNCVSQITLYTDNLGYYSGKLGCSNADILKVKITTLNCDGQTLAQTKEVPASKVVEANFSICIVSTTCSAKFSFTKGAAFGAVKFVSNASEANVSDEIIERVWDFGDGETLKGNIKDPTHNYKSAGAYTVCLTIKTKNGCTSTTCEKIEITAECKSDFNYEVTAAGVRFNSNNCSVSLNDVITSRIWNFGDGTPLLSGNIINPLHQFKAGTYTVCLTIVSKNGCEKKECKQVVVKETAPTCEVRFGFERVSNLKLRFNILSSIVNSNTTIERTWNFGDGSPVSKEVNPLHEFAKVGSYNVCLTIKTSSGCISTYCLTIKVGEPISADNTPIKIVSLYPSPATTELKALIFSKNQGIAATVAIVNVYGETKWSKSITLTQGNNPFEIKTSMLLPGPYFLRVTTMYGVVSKSFYKL